MSTKSVTKQASANWAVDPSSRFHRSCHVGRRLKGRGKGGETCERNKNCLVLCPSMNDMTGGQKVERGDCCVNAGLSNSQRLQYLGRSSELTTERWREEAVHMFLCSEQQQQQQSAIIFPLTSQFIASLSLCYYEAKETPKYKTMFVVTNTYKCFTSQYLEFVNICTRQKY